MGILAPIRSPALRWTMASIDTRCARATTAVPAPTKQDGLATVSLVAYSGRIRTPPTRSFRAAPPQSWARNCTSFLPIRWRQVSDNWSTTTSGVQRHRIGTFSYDFSDKASTPRKELARSPTCSLLWPTIVRKHPYPGGSRPEQASSSHIWIE